jgi:molybdate transport system substrate-binding protein
MSARSITLAALFAFLTMLAQTTVAKAAEIKVLAAFGIMAVMEDLGTKFERASGHKLVMMFDGFTRVVKRVQDGETADVVVIPRQGIDVFVRAARLLPKV